VTSEHPTLTAASSYSALYQGLTEPVWVIDPESARFLDANGYAVQQLGFTPQEIVSMGVSDINKTVSDQSAWKALAASMKPQQTVVYMAELVCKSGDTISVEISLTMEHVNGSPVFLAVTRTQQ